MLSAGMLTDLASATMVRRRGLLSMSPPPLRAATVSSLIIRVKTLTRFASAAPFLCLIVCHLEWPDMMKLPRKSAELTAHLTTRAGDSGYAGVVHRHADTSPRLSAKIRRYEDTKLIGCVRRRPAERPALREFRELQIQTTGEQALLVFAVLWLPDA